MSVASEEEDTFFEELEELRQNYDEGRFRKQAFSLAVKRNRIDIVRFMLISNYDVDMTHMLSIAAEKGDCGMATLLLDDGVEVDETNDCGGTALHKAATSGHSEMVQLLIDRGANVNAVDSDYETPLHLCVCTRGGDLFCENRAKTLLVLVSNNANTLALNKYRCTPLHCLVERSWNVELVGCFLDLLESPEAMMTALMSGDCDGWLPFHYANTPVIASLLIKSLMNDTPQKIFPPSICCDMLVARDNQKMTLLDLSRDWLVGVNNDEQARQPQELILYLEAYTEQSVVVPTVAAEGPMKIPLNPMYNDFQRSIAKRFLKSVIGVPKWLVPSKDEHGAIVFEAQLPRDIQYAVLSFLSLSDIMVM